MSSMNKVVPGICPACRKDQLQIVDRFRFRDFDGSIFNMEADFAACAHCGFVRVLVPFSDADISEHYRNESLYSSLSGVGVGGLTPQDMDRYAQYARLLDGILKKTSSVADIGCASGGWLKYLRHHAGYPGKLTGVDVDTRSLSSLTDSDVLAVEGSALNLNLPQDSVDLVFYTHIYEHILDLDRIVEQMKRVLSDGGYAFIEVPDATNYSRARVHDFFWLGMKEHVNHFSADALCSLLQRHGMEIRGVRRTQFPMKGGAFYPSLIVVAQARKNVEVSRFNPEQNESGWLQQHMAWERGFAAKTKSNIDAFFAGKSDIAIWGIGLEYFNLLSQDVVQLVAGTVLLDSNAAKQAHTVSGCRILAPKDTPSQGKWLLCTSQMSWQPIVQNAHALGFDRNRIFCI